MQNRKPPLDTLAGFSIPWCRHTNFAMNSEQFTGNIPTDFAGQLKWYVEEAHHFVNNSIATHLLGNWRYAKVRLYPNSNFEFSIWLNECTFLAYDREKSGAVNCVWLPSPVPPPKMAIFRLKSEFDLVSNTVPNHVFVSNLQLYFDMYTHTHKRSVTQ